MNDVPFAIACQLLLSALLFGLDLYGINPRGSDFLPVWFSFAGMWLCLTGGAVLFRRSFP